MPWFRVDDGFYDHPKVVGLSSAAVGLWTLAGSYCARHLTDGVITARQVRALGGTATQVNALVSCGLWGAIETETRSKSYFFRDWNDFQPNRETVLAKREKEAEKKREWRERKAANQAKRENVPGGHPEGRTEGQTGGLPEGRTTGLPQSVPLYPTRPDPTRPVLTTGRGEYVREVGGDAAQAPPPEIPAEWIDRPHLARCDDHAGMTDAPACWKCRDAREAATAAATERHRAENARIAADAAARLACDLCDDSGHVLGDDRRPLVPAIPCRHDQDGNAEAIMAARAAAEAEAAAEARARETARAAAAEARARRAELAAHRRRPTPEPEAVTRDPFSA